MYELKSLIWTDIDRLVKVCKQDRSQCCDNMSGQYEPEAELRTRRSQMVSLNKLIEDYMEIHGGK